MAILLHGEHADRSYYDPLIPVLHAAGLAVLAVDLRGHGESIEPAGLKLRTRAEQRDPKLFREMTRDVEAAYRWLSRRPEVDPARFVLIGAMSGGTLALEYAARDKSVDGVIIMAPTMGAPGQDTSASARKYGNRKLLLLTGPEDRPIAEAVARLVPGAVVNTAAGRLGESTDPDAPQIHKLIGNSSVDEATLRRFLMETAGAVPVEPVVASLKGQVFYTPNTREADRLSPDNLRWFSSPAEAQARGYRPPKSRKKS